MATITDAKAGAEALERQIERSRSMVFLGGAGVSTASGIPDFRSADGLYQQHFAYPPEEMLSHGFYVSHPEEFFRFFRERMVALDAKPNRAHEKLAELEATGPLEAVLTQNIDGLHQMAGSKRVLELHGSVHRNICQSCGAVYPVEWVMEKEGVPHCDLCGGAVKPDVVLYGESLDQRVLQEAVNLISRADLLVIGGTSLVVWPVAGLVQYFNGDALTIVNLQPTPQDSYADLVINADIAEVFDF